MTLLVEVRVNAESVCAVEVANLTLLSEPDSVNTYQWRYPAGSPSAAVGTVLHRYGDGAVALSHNVLGEVAARLQLANEVVTDG